MRNVKTYIHARQKEFARHPFFQKLASAQGKEEIVSLLPAFTFWVAAFQDALALNKRNMNDPELRRLAYQHHKEEAHHDSWFFGDLARLGLAIPTSRDLFGRKHQATRYATFALVGEVVRATHDACRLALVLSFESTGGIFFEQMARWQKRIGGLEGLKYFGTFHLEAELAQEIFEKELDAQLDAMVLEPEVEKEAIRVVDRAFAAFFEMFDGLMDEKAPARLPLAHEIAGLEEAAAATAAKS